MQMTAVAQPFRAMVVRENASGAYVRDIEERRFDDLPAGDLLIKVLYSSLNYKDGLSASGNRGVTRRYPHTPGVDAAGVVVESQSSAFVEGDEVIVIDYDLGMNTPGGFGQYIRTPAEWVVKRPANLSLYESMSYGTAGFTAAMCLEKLQAAGVGPEQGDIVVTGATGGVGAVAIALLKYCGYRVVAATGKMEQSDFLRTLGAAEVVSRVDVQNPSGRPLLSARWTGAIDTVGGSILSAVLAATRPNGVVACCGNAAGSELVTSVYPFILRGVSLLGIDAGNYPIALRDQLWQKLATTWKLPQLSALSRTVSLDALDTEIEQILHGLQVGRVVIDLWA